jgi:hypothetical protein
MLMDYYNQLTKQHKAILLMITGLILLAYQQDWKFLYGLRNIIDFVIFVIAIIMLVYGFMMFDGPKKVMALINKEK